MEIQGHCMTPDIPKKWIYPMAMNAHAILFYSAEFASVDALNTVSVLIHQPESPMAKDIMVRLENGAASIANTNNKEQITKILTQATQDLQVPGATGTLLSYFTAETLAAVPFPTDHLSRVMVENLADHLNKMSKHDFVELVRQTLALATQSFAVADPYAAIIATVVMENFFMAVLENKKHINTITKLTAFDAYFKARDAHLRTFA